MKKKKKDGTPRPAVLVQHSAAWFKRQKRFWSGEFPEDDWKHDKWDKKRSHEEALSSKDTKTKTRPKIDFKHPKSKRL